ncbi:MAG TPA: nucleotidyltransferase domain-containing protein [Desulfuromonadales bacterium]|nr:nucleotidyltransferase domain-containing protein [Desulfuromonadales bacterium]
MAVATDIIVGIVKQYIRELSTRDILVDEAILFGSFAHGNASEESDIDIALISGAFSGNRFDDRRRIVPLRRGIDSRIEPIPFRPEQFAGGGNLIDEIKKTGVSISL